MRDGEHRDGGWSCELQESKSCWRERRGAEGLPEMDMETDPHSTTRGVGDRHRW